MILLQAWSIYRQQITLAAILSILIISSAQVRASESVQETLASFAWEKRQLVVFAPSGGHPLLERFDQSAANRKDGISDRRLQIWRISPETPVTVDYHLKNGLHSSQFYEYFQVSPKEFRVLLIGYDQGEKLRQQRVDLDTVFAKIDRMPMRIREMSEKASVLSSGN